MTDDSGFPKREAIREKIVDRDPENTLRFLGSSPRHALRPSATLAVVTETQQEGYPIEVVLILSDPLDNAPRIVRSFILSLHPTYSDACTAAHALSALYGVAEVPSRCLS